MGDFRICYKSPTHEIEVQIPFSMGLDLPSIGGPVGLKKPEKNATEDKKHENAITTNEDHTDIGTIAGNVGLFMLNLVLNSMKK